jgi:membrane-associated phospholipid phosphatase
MLIPGAVAFVSLCLGAGTGHPLFAQDCPAPPVDCQQAPRNIGWKETALFGAGILGIMALDQTLFDAIADNRGATGDVLLEPARAFGYGGVMAVVSGGTLLMGLATKDSALTRTGERLVATFALATGLVHTTKFLFGRARPSAGEGPWSYHPFTPGSSFYSGHSTMAFALATALSEEIDSPYATVLLYTTATVAGLSRVYDQNHWVSDVVAGAVMGIASAKFVYGRWTVFGLRAPSFLAGPEGVQVSYRLEF